MLNRHEHNDPPIEDIMNAMVLEQGPADMGGSDYPSTHDEREGNPWRKEYLEGKKGVEFTTAWSISQDDYPSFEDSTILDGDREFTGDEWFYRVEDGPWIAAGDNEEQAVRIAYEDVTSGMSSFDIMKEAGWTPKTLKSIERFEEDLRVRDAGNVSKRRRERDYRPRHRGPRSM